ncbi:MAG: hypothetical protein IJ462_03910 [Clostridia bacterium]|nr:hypothetical protein [Clostridia bacterium]
MKKLLAIFFAVLLVALSVVSVSAAVTADNHKDSLENYVGKGNLKVKKELINGFDNINPIFKPGTNVTMDYENQKEGDGCVSINFAGDKLFETENGDVKFSIKDRRRETIKMWVYINDISLLSCDHDSVYDKEQAGSGTLIFSFAESDRTSNKYRLQHTLEGNGWHLVEISFNTHNNIYEDFIKVDLANIGWMSVTGQGRGALQFKFDGLTKYTYSNDGYTEPECPKNGKWISTCDYDSLDGGILTEWYASSFDLNEKVQGSSSLSLTAHKEHVDFRAVWGGLNVPINRQKDCFHFDIYISDVETIGKVLQARLSHHESGGEGSAVISFGYDLANSCARAADGSKGFKNGWNSVDIPVFSMDYNIDKNYYKNGIDYRVEHVVFFWEGASEDKEYTVKYDNMYIYEREASGSTLSGNSTLGYTDEKIAQYAKEIGEKTRTELPKGCTDEDIAKIKAKLETDYPALVFTFNEDGTITVAEKPDNTMMYIVIGAIALVFVILVLIIVIVLVKRKKKTK